MVSIEAAVLTVLREVLAGKHMVHSTQHSSDWALYYSCRQLPIQSAMASKRFRYSDVGFGFGYRTGYGSCSYGWC